MHFSKEIYIVIELLSVSSLFGDANRSLAIVFIEVEVKVVQFTVEHIQRVKGDIITLQN